MAKKKPSVIDRFMALSEEQKAAQLADLEHFDRENPGPSKRDALPGKPLTAAQKRIWNKAKTKRGRPEIGEGSTVVPVSIERGLLKKADAYAKQHHLKRSQLIAQGIRLVIAGTKSKAG
jgi:hypothetical protein